MNTRVPLLGHSLQHGVHENETGGSDDEDTKRAKIASMEASLLVAKYLAIFGWSMKATFRKDEDDTTIIRTVLPLTEAAWLLAIILARQTPYWYFIKSTKFDSTFGCQYKQYHFSHDASHIRAKTIRFGSLIWYMQSYLNVAHSTDIHDTPVAFFVCSFSCSDPVASYSSFPSLVFHFAGRRSLFDLISQQ